MLTQINKKFDQINWCKQITKKGTTHFRLNQFTIDCYFARATLVLNDEENKISFSQKMNVLTSVGDAKYLDKGSN